MKNLLEKLKGGDLRSIGRANEVVSAIQKDHSLFADVFRGMYHDDPVVRMRSADVVEKITREYPGLLTGFEEVIIKELSRIEQQEVCWHIALLLPRLAATKEQEKAMLEILKDYLNHKSKIVNVNAMEGLAMLAIKNNLIKKEVIRIIKTKIRAGSPAIQARGRKLIKKLSAH